MADNDKKLPATFKLQMKRGGGTVKVPSKPGTEKNILKVRTGTKIRGTILVKDDFYK